MYMLYAPIGISEVSTDSAACVNNHIGCPPGVHSLPIGNAFLFPFVSLS
jgi:hypothetical protein